jgi:hypothetical protein
MLLPKNFTFTERSTLCVLTLLFVALHLAVALYFTQYYKLFTLRSTRAVSAVASEANVMTAIAASSNPLSNQELLCLLRRSIFPRPSALNPARSTWLRAHLDWHDLVPETLSRFERDKAKTSLLSILVGLDSPTANAEPCSVKEAQEDNDIHIYPKGSQEKLVDFYKSKGLSTDDLILAVGDVTEIADRERIDPDDLSEHLMTERHRPRHGPLAKMHACDRLRDPCILHSTARACFDDAFCGWCEKSSSCMSRTRSYFPNLQAGKKTLVCESGTLIVSKDSIPESIKPNEIISQLFFTNSGSYKLVHQADPTKCSFIVDRRNPVFFRFSDANSKMAFHFMTETAPSWIRAVDDEKGLEFLNVDIYVTQEAMNNVPMFASAFSDSCPHLAESFGTNITVCYYNKNIHTRNDSRRKKNDVATTLTSESVFGLPSPNLEHINIDPNAGKLFAPLGQVTMFELESVLETIAKGKRLGTSGLLTVSQHFLRLENPSILFPKSTFTFSSFLLQSLLLHFEEGDIERQFRNGKPMVTFISRREKRFILNEASLVRVALALGAQVKVVVLESLPLFEQLKIFRSTDVLIGVHGSGLINSQFMRKGSAVIQLIPLGVQGAASFFQSTALAAGVRYYELKRTLEDKTNPFDGVHQHLHFLDSKHSPSTLVTDPRGSDAVSRQTFFAFYINQDTRFDHIQFGKVLKEALKG